MSTAKGQPVHEILFSCLDPDEDAPIVVDAGARSGMFDLPPSYASRAQLVAFEPNPAEFQKLNESDPGSRGAPPRFRSERYVDSALWDDETERTLYITAGRGATTMMGHADRDIVDKIYREGEPRSFYEMALRHVRTTQIKARRLDGLFDPNDTVDYLKIDVEGAELRVLRGADGLLSRGKVLLVRSEFVVVPYYEAHPLLGDQHAFLDDHGFRLIAIELGHPGYSRGPTRIPRSQDRRLVTSGDAVFIVDPDKTSLDPVSAHRLGVVSIALGFSSLGVSLLRDAELLESRTIDEIETVLSRVPLRRRAASRWHAFPQLIGRVSARLKR
ncbi:MAG: FkbM family methyltransferase [Actinomycetota bacterium]